MFRYDYMLTAAWRGHDIQQRYVNDTPLCTAVVRKSNLLLRMAPIVSVIQLLKQGGGDDAQLSAAWGKVGAYYTERGKWGKAVPFFKQAKDLEMMAECYYRSVALCTGLTTSVSTTPAYHFYTTDQS